MATGGSMQEYHKINSLFKRDERNKFTSEYAEDVFEYLKDNLWTFTEKVDGTNVRVYWDQGTNKVTFGGRTDNASMPVFLLQRLQELFPPEKFGPLFTASVCLYGEGYGAKIQKGGGNYKADGQDFVLFDVLIGDFWLERHNVEDIAHKLGIRCVPFIGQGTIADGIDLCKKGFTSTWGPFEAEGIVLRPKVELKTRGGHRIITKLKVRDFR